MNTQPSTIRNVAIIGTHHSGKTSLVESLLFLTGAITRRGKILDGTSTCDYTPESIARQMSTSVTAVSTNYRGYHFQLLDCPGFIDFREEVKLALVGVDTAIIVVESDPERVVQIEPLLKYIDSIGIAAMVFVNKVDKPDSRFDESLEALLEMSRRCKGQHPLVPVHFPIKSSTAFGYVDILKCEAFKYSASGTPEPMEIPDDLQERIKQGHEILLENLADTDDAVLEMVVEGKEPPLSILEDDLKKAVRTGGMIPVLVGSGVTDAGVLCLLDAIIALCPSPLDHDYKDAEGNPITVSEDGPIIAQIVKTNIHPQFGKLSLARIFSGTIRSDSKLVNNSNDVKGEERIGGLYHLQGKKQEAVQTAGPGELVAIARLEHARTGDTLASNGCRTVMSRPAQSQPLYVLAISPKSRADEAKVLPLIAKLLDEDPTLTFEWDPELHEHRLGGHGELLLSVALQRLERQYHLQLTTERPKVAYKEAIQKYVEAHGKHKKQTGGHGQYGEVYIKIEPLERGTGNKFSQSIVGGSIPHQYIPGVEKGVKEALLRGPLAGFPVVDVSVNLYDGSFHDVDSDEMSFRMAAILAIREGLPKTSPQILEPIASVTVTAPSPNISGVLAQITARHGQILGYSAKEDQPGWDEVNAYVPQRELWDYIIDLRTLTHGLGSYSWEFSHLAPVTGAVEAELKKQSTTAAT